MSLRTDLEEKLEAAIWSEGVGTPDQQRDGAIRVAALAFALSVLPAPPAPFPQDEEGNPIPSKPSHPDYGS